MKKNIASNINEIIHAYEIDLVPMQKIASKYGCTRYYIYLLLKKHGVDTRKRKITVSCSCCGAQMQRVKSHIRNRKNLFCTKECYDAWMAARGEEYVPNRTGQRIARSTISRIFPLKPEHVVHHIDRNNFHNSPDNLLVFANQGDHIRHHRGIKVPPIWPPTFSSSCP